MIYNSMVMKKSAFAFLIFTLLFAAISVAGAFSYAKAEDYDLVLDLTHLTAIYGEVKGGEDLTMKIVAEEGYLLPDELTVEVGQTQLSSANYDHLNGVLTIAGEFVTDDVTITAEGVPNLIENISVPDIEKIYDGETVYLTVEGTIAGDRIYYKLAEDEEYALSYPDFREATEQTVYYKIERKGYLSFYGSAKVTINPVVVSKPEANQKTFFYSGEEQTYDMPASDYYTVIGDKQTYADEYQVLVYLNDKANYVWEDYSTDDLTFDFVIEKAKVAIPSKDDTRFVYNGKEQTYSIVQSDLYKISGNVQTNAGKYVVKATLKDKANYVWENLTNENLAFDFVIEKAELNEPQKDETEYVYDGSEKTYYIPESEYYAVSGNKQTNAGVYTVKVELKDKTNYSWKGSAGNLYYEFAIAKAKVDEPPADATEFVYNGNEQTYYIPQTEYYAFSGEKQTEAGLHEVRIYLKDKDNYAWNDSTSEDLFYSFVIERMRIEKPTTDESVFYYDGEEKTYYITASAYYEVTGNTQINAGEYEVTVSIKDKTNFVWSDLSEGDLVYLFVIRKTTYDAAEIEFESKKFVYDGSAKSIFVTGALPDGVMVEYENNAQTEVGIYVVTAKFKVDLDNYDKIEDKTATLHIFYDRMSGEDGRVEISAASGLDSRAILKTTAIQPTLRSVLRLKTGEKVYAAYDVAVEQTANDGEYKVKVAIPEFAKKIKVYMINEGVKEMNFTYENGFLTFNTDKLGRIAVVGKGLSTPLVIVSAVIIAALLIVGMSLLLYSKSKIKSATESLVQTEENEANDGKKDEADETENSVTDDDKSKAE